MFENEVWVTNIDGSDVRRIARWPAIQPFWSADDTRIYFTMIEGTTTRIGFSYADGSNGGLIPRSSQSGQASDRSGDWSNDGSHLAFVSTRAGGHALFTVRADGSDLTQITDGALEVTEPRWSPDGKQIALSAIPDSTGPIDLYVVNADGSGLRHVRTDAVLQSWSPDGSRIMFRTIEVGPLTTTASDGTNVAPFGSGDIKGDADWRGLSAGTAVVSAGGLHSLSLSATGTVSAWGYNGFGELGGATANLTQDRPVPIRSLRDIGCISAGYLHSLAADTAGNVYSWGWNGLGQLGIGTVADSGVPVRVPGLSGVKAVAAGTYHSLAVRADGTVWAWGWNGYGQLGDGTTANRLTPVRVVGLTGIVAVAAGGVHSIALRNDGTVWTWGYNGQGQLGVGSRVDARTPVMVPGLAATAISAGWAHSVATTPDLSVRTWGYNAYGQLGIGTTLDAVLPQLVNGSGGTSISAGLFHTVSVDASGRMSAWGYGGLGQICNGTTEIVASRPRASDGPPILGEVSAGGFHTVVVSSAVDVEACGYNGQGQLGTGLTPDSLVRTPVVGLG